MSAAFIGLDLAKSVFQVHGVDVHGKVVVTKRLRRDAVLAFFANLAPCGVGMEACSGSHFWAREIARLGHTVRLMAPQYVKPYVKRHKNDRPKRSARRPSMRFVAVKSEEQQGTLAIHRVRETLVAQKTQLINALRAHLAEFGIVGSQGAGKVSQLTAVLWRIRGFPPWPGAFSKGSSTSCATPSAGSRTSTPGWPSRLGRPRCAGG